MTTEKKTKQEGIALNRVTIGLGHVTVELAETADNEPTADIIENRTGEVLATISSNGQGYEAFTVIANHLGK